MISTSCRLEVRLYKANGIAYRVLPRKSIVGDAQFRVTATEGYADGNFTLAGKPSDYPDLVRRRKVRVYVRYRFPGDTQDRSELGWSGYVGRFLPSRDSKGLPIIPVNCYGFWGTYASRSRTMMRYANPEGEDRSVVFEDLAQRFVAAKYAAIGVNVVVYGDSNAISSDLDLLQYDAYEKKFGDVGRDLATSVGLIAIGGDVDPATDYDRLFFRAYDNPALPIRHTIHVPGPQISATEREVDTSAQATVLYLTGGDVRYPNILGAATAGNTLFNYPIPTSGDSAQNLLLNGNFNTPTPRQWSANDGASFKEQSDENVTPYSGNFYARLDNIGENIEQDGYTFPVAPVAGRTYICDCRVKSDFEGKDATGEIRVQWTNAAGGAIGALQTVAIAPTDVIYDLFSGPVIPPAGATGAKVIAILTGQGVPGDHDYALLIGLIRIYDPSQILQAGWQFNPQGAAHANTLKWADQSNTWTPGYGYAVYLDVVAEAVDGQDARLESASAARFPVTGGQSITAGFIVALAPGSPNIDVRPEIYEWESDNSFSGIIVPDITLSSTNWTVIAARKDFNENGAQGYLNLTFRGSGQIYIGGAFAFDTNRIVDIGGTITGGAGVGQTDIIDVSNPDAFTESAVYKATLRSDVLNAAGTPLYIEAEAVGDLDAEDTQSAIITDDAAEFYGTAYFQKYGFGIDRPNLEIEGVISTGVGTTTVSMMPGELVRAIGPWGEDLLPIPLPVNEKLITLSRGKVIIKPFLQDNPKDPSRAIEALIKTEIANGTLPGGTSASGGSGGSVVGGTGDGSTSSSLSWGGVYNSGTTYAAGAICFETDSLWHSLSNGNTGNDPSTDAGAHWERMISVSQDPGLTT